MSKFNQWFLGLPEGRKEVLRADKWLMADAAFNAREKELSDLSTRFTALMQQNNTLAAENERLSEKLAAMDSQKPYKYLSPNGELRENCEAKNSDEWGAKFEPLYTKPVPADKPSVAVPDVNYLASTLMDAWKFAEPSHGVTVNMTSYVSTFVDMARAVINHHFESAPSQSQQSDAVDLLRQIFELYEDGVDCYENPDEGAGYLGKAFRIDDDTFKLCVALLDSSEDRCPSHESEQE